MNPPELFHTRVRGRIEEIDFNKWNDLVRIAHILVFRKVGSLDALKRITAAGVREGNHDGKEGYHFVPELNASIRGVDANLAWRISFQLAKSAGVPLLAQFEWRENSNAAFPGEKGYMEWKPT